MKRKIYDILQMIGASILVCLGFLCIPIEMDNQVLWSAVICVLTLIAAVVSMWSINKRLDWISVVTLILSFLMPVWSLTNFRSGADSDAILFGTIPVAVLVNHYIAKNKKCLLVFHISTLVSVCVALKFSMFLYYNNVSHDGETPGVGAFELIAFSIYFLIFSIISVLLKKEKSLSPETVSEV